MKFEPIHAGHALSDTVITDLFAGFCDLSLPQRHWTHAAHLISALCLIRDFGLAQAEAKIPGMIRAFNISNGVVNSDSEGYHQTLTIFYLRILARFYADNKHTPFVQICELALNAPIGERKYPLTFYSKDLLFSLKARKNWVEPDLKPL